MSYTLFDAMKHSRHPYQTMLLRQIATSDESFSVLPFVPKGGEGFSYEREVELPEFDFINPGGSVSESTGRSERVLVTKREATSDFYVDNYAQDNMGDQISPLERQTAQKLKAAGRMLAQKIIDGGAITSFAMEPFQAGPLVDALVDVSPFIQDRHGPGELKFTLTGTLLQFRAPGDVDFGEAVEIASDGTFVLKSSSPSKWIKVTLDVSDATADAIRRITFSTSSHEFDGLERLVPPHRVRTSLASEADGSDFTFGILEELRDMVKNRSGQLAFLMRSELRRKYNASCRMLGGVVPQWVQGPHVAIPSFDGIPILVNDFIPKDEAKGSSTSLSSIYLVNFTPDGEGVYMGCLGGERHDVEGDPRNTTVLGFRIRDLGQKEGESKVGRRISWYGALAVGSDLSVARASEIKTAA